MKQTVLLLAAVLVALSFATPVTVRAQNPICPPSSCHIQ